jgi:membrane protein required for colicin V production
MIFTSFDYSILGIIAFFALIGLIRGFIREVFSIMNWVVAAIVTVYLRPILSNLILIKINIPIIADLISNLFLFTATFIFMSIITSNIAKGIADKFTAFVDVPFGLVFGAIKGYILSALIFSIILNIYGNKENEPDWFAESKIYQPLSIGAEIVKPFTDSLFGSLSERDQEKEQEDEEFDKKTKPAEKSIKQRGKVSRYVERIYKSKKTKNESEKRVEPSRYTDLPSQNLDKDNGYKREQIKKMNRLINTISD